MISDDFGQLMLDIVRVGGVTSDPAECDGGRVDPSLLDIPSRRFGKKKESDTKNQSPQELDGHRNSVGAGVHSILGRVDDTIGDQDTDGDTELISGYDSTSDLSRGNLREVQDDGCRDETGPLAYSSDSEYVTHPTPKPATSRPATMRPKPVEAVCRAAPTQKTVHPLMIVILRPK